LLACSRVARHPPFEGDWATLRALERLAKKKESRALFLPVLAQNSVAIHPYEEPGFEIKSMNMEKRL